MRVVFWFCLIVMLACKNEIVSTIVLCIGGLWCVIKLLDVMSKGGF